RRPEYRDSVTIRTSSVDASKLVSLGDDADSRNGYWGFTPKEFPRNARVWYPDGAGPFPLVLVVHGNHDMKDFSDPGYDYLGNLLASRGFILASVDENFLNGGIRNENDARGWMLLKHLELWREFNDSAGGPFHGMVDMDRIALIGHSRGGEAVGHAAAFNRLSHYPDDANVEFDFGFDIRSLIAIAPVDGQYKPADRYVPVRDVSYLVFHGSHDGDVTNFAGLRQYQRVALGQDDFKSAVYVYRANHGQWNTVWGAHDNGPRSARILDLRGLLPAEEQRRFAEVFVSAFLEATLRDDDRYLPLFRDHRVAGDWLPPTMYVTRFEEGTFRPVAAFDDDIDVTTGSVDGVTLRADSMATWKEGGLQMRSANSAAEGSTMQNYAVTLGWNNRIAGEDTTRTGPPAQYVVTLPDSLAAEWGLGSDATLQFLLMPTEAMPSPRADPDTTAGDSTKAGSGARSGQGGRSGRGGASRGDDESLPPVDLTVEVVDASGAMSRIALSAYGPVRRPLSIRVYRRDDWEDRFASDSEMVLQSYVIPLADFDGVDPRAIREVRFEFDRATAGTVVIDDIGFGTPRPAFLQAPLAGTR
ncbi:MAG: alpha/beta hydrolase, partial [Longimicrobiales bacterium]